MVDNKYEFTLLDTQYRMKPEISQWPLAQFYQGQVKNDTNVQLIEYGANQPLLFEKQPCIWVEVTGQEHKDRHGSTFNEQEVDAVVKLVLDFQTRHQVSNDWLASPDHLRIITFYKAQEDTLRFKLDQYHLNVTLSTVDAAQGCEADIVILSFVRGTSAFMGFIKDMQRLNVALTRARFKLVCVGNLKAIADLRKVGGNYELIEMARDALDRSHIVDHPGPLPPPPPVNAAKKRAARGPNSKRSSFTDGRDALKERKKRRRERGKFKDGEETTSKLQI